MPFCSTGHATFGNRHLMRCFLSPPDLPLLLLNSTQPTKPLRNVTPKRQTQDTSRRCAALEEKGLLYVGSGVSGGEEGARYGPSLMPGGNPAAWPHIKDIFQVSHCYHLVTPFTTWPHIVPSGHTCY